MITAAGYELLITFIVLFVIFAIVGFMGRSFRRGDMTQLHEWGDLVEEN
ncbi:MAG: FeoB-associated Cys-rich membrane protein [Caldisphaera sp.]